MVSGIQRAINSPKITVTTTIGKELIESLDHKLTTRYGGVESTHILAAATFLDPRFRQKGFSKEEALSKINDALLAELDTLLVEELPIELPLVTPATVDDDIIWGHFDRTIKDLTISVTASQVELQCYKDDIFVERKKNPLDFWKTKAASYPKLQILAKKYLPIPATSVPSERTFSKAGQVISDRRSRLKSKNVEKILFLNANMKNIT